MSQAAKTPSTFQIPERLCALWCGFAAFVIAFVLRLVASGELVSAVFTACVACFVGCWMARLAGAYLNASLRSDDSPEPASKEAGDDAS